MGAVDGNEGRTTFAGAVREARRVRRWSQETLAKAARVSEKTVRRVEAGEALSAETVLSISAALDIVPGSFEAAATAPRVAIPSEDERTDEIRRVLAAEAEAGSTVVATDTRACLAVRFGLDPEAARGWLERTPDIGRMADRAAFATVGSTLLLAMGAAAGFALGGGAGCVLALLSCLPMAVTSDRFRDDGDVAVFRFRIEETIEMRRVVYAVARDRVVMHSLGGDGTVSAHTFPISGMGHEARDEGEGHLTLVLNLLDGKAELPFLPRTPAVEALAERLAVAA